MTTMTPSPRPTSEPTLDLDGLDLAAIRAGALAGRPVAVLGFARSGIALARFFVDAGAVVTVYDGRPASELDDAVRSLEGRPVRLLAGPAVDPADAWRGAALVATSPSVTPDYPTTEPRLRAALVALRTARQAGDRSAPAIVSEPDLVLRLCPAPTIGITGTKGKTTTSALSHALLAADPTHRAILGGNIGRPLVERLPELRPDDRVVIELSELQLPTLSRGTSVAVFTNVTSDHLDRHGTLEAYRAVKRRFAEMADPAGALVVNLDDPVTAGYAGLGGRRTVAYRLDRPTPGGLGTVDGWIVADGVERLALAGPSTEPACPPPMAGSCPSTSCASPAGTTSRTRSRRSPWRCCSGSRPMPSGPRPARSAAWSTGSRPSASSTASASSTTRRAPSRMPSSPRSGPSTRRSCSSPADGTRGST